MIAAIFCAFSVQMGSDATGFGLRAPPVLVARRVTVAIQDYFLPSLSRHWLFQCEADDNHIIDIGLNIAM